MTNARPNILLACNNHVRQECLDKGDLEMDKLRQLAIVSRNRIHQRFVSSDLTPEPMGVRPVFDEPLPGGVPFDQLVKVSGPRIGVDLLSNLTDLGVVQKQGA